MRSFYKYLGFLILILISACNPDNTDFSSENILARVHDEYLYESEIDGIVPPDASARDSLTIVRNYIQNWIQQQLLVNLAENNLTGEQLDFDKELEEYRNSLILYTYENLWINQQLDTFVSNKEIEEYYEQHKHNFELKDNIVKINYAKLNEESEVLDKMRSFFQSQDEAMRDSLDIYCQQFAVDYFLNQDQWIYFDELLNVVPIDTYSKEAFLQNNRFVEVNQSPYVYMVEFTDFSVKDGISPLSFERERIRSMILNKRKIDLKNEMKHTIFQNAMENDEFEIY